MAIALFLVAGAGALACGEKTTGGAPGSEASGPPHVTKFRIGRSAASDGTVVAETDSLNQGEPVYVSFEVKNVPPGSQARVLWSDSSKKMISEEKKKPGSGGAVSFLMKGAAGLAAGEYLVELYYGGPETPEKWTWLGAKSFRVGQKRRS